MIFKIQTAGRINLIGEHTDHQFGLVLPISINAKITIYGSRRKDDLIIAYSENFKEKKSISLAEITTFKPIKGYWGQVIVLCLVYGGDS